jgi:hypothetical protein
MLTVTDYVYHCSITSISDFTCILDLHFVSIWRPFSREINIQNICAIFFVFAFKLFELVLLGTLCCTVYF